MDIKKQFKFIGTFKKVHEEDDQPIDNFKADIYCYTNGNILLEVDAATNRYLNHKSFYESAPIYKDQNFTEDEWLNPLLFLQLDHLENELVQPPYEGDYKIEGKTPEGWNLEAIIAQAGFSISLGFDKSQENMEGDDKKYLIRLKELCVDYAPQYDKGKTVQLKSGLVNLKVIHNFSASFLDSKAELSIVSVSSGTTGSDNENETLSAEMILKGIDENEQDSYALYYSWFESLLSFASGRHVEQIYRIETTQNNGSRKEVEYWSGSQFSTKRRGIAVIQQPDLHLFIQKCASEVTWDNFYEKGLGLALHWYIDAFTSTTVDVGFILLCTVLETLNKKHSAQSSKRLISKSIYRRIKDKIIEIINQEKQSIDDKNNLEKYELFQKKVEEAFSCGSYNQIGNLRTSLAEMLELYQVPYTDLFPELEFIKIRNKIVHEGFIGVNVAPELRKLSNLVVRIVLSILKYQGDYMESRRIEIVDESGCSRHGLMCRHFPFSG